MSPSITQSRQLIVEGPDDEYLFRALIRHLGLSGIEIQNLEGIDNLRPYLRTLVQTSGFDEVTTLGIVRDTDVDARNAFRSVHDALGSAGLPAPNSQLQSEGIALKVVDLILPHEENSGTLEDVCLASVAADSAILCLDDYIECVNQSIQQSPRNLSKARLQAFLASRERPGLLLGQAASRGYWQWEHTAFDPLKQLLRML